MSYDMRSVPDKIMTNQSYLL